nr:retrovirus-related Pol polyprotein from transposon TNT 1-94 [Tanacetum cinerariifolium]
HVDFDELTVMASEHRSSGPALNEMTPRTISSGLVPTSSPSTSYVPPSRNDWDLLFQPMFDELLNPPPSVVNQTPEAIAPIAEVIPLAHIGNDPLFGVPIPEVTSAQSTTPASPQAIVQTDHLMPHHNNKWTKDHPLNNIIVDTLMVEKSKLDEDKEGKAIDPSHYRAFADADHAGCQDTRWSTSGSVQFLGERLISWSSKRQKSAAISSTEAKYIALSGCCA